MQYSLDKKDDNTYLEMGGQVIVIGKADKKTRERILSGFEGLEIGDGMRDSILSMLGGVLSIWNDGLLLDNCSDSELLLLLSYVGKVGGIDV